MRLATTQMNAVYMSIQAFTILRAPYTRFETIYTLDIATYRLYTSIPNVDYSSYTLYIGTYYTVYR